jgi:DNA helicase HerA-like ATPase
MVPEGQHVSDWDIDALDMFRRRWENLERSALALMFRSDASDQTSIEELLRDTRLLEFGSWFDADEANTAMALIFALLYEQRLSEFDADAAHAGLSALAVIDEAHRIIPAAPATGDPRLLSSGRETAEILARMLAECRSLGQGILVSEQSASAVHPNVLINTSTKIVHAVLYGADKQSLAEGLALAEPERDYLAYLPVGQALALTTATYQPVQITVPQVTYKRPGSQETSP